MGTSDRFMPIGTNDGNSDMPIENVWLADLSSADRNQRVSNKTTGPRENPFSADNQAKRLFEISMSAGSIGTTEFLSLNHIEDAAYNLEGLKQFGRLKHLWLEGTGIIDSNLKHIAPLNNLEELLLTNNSSITDAGVRQLES